MTDDIGGGSLNIIYESKSFVSCTQGESLGLIIYLESISDQIVVYVLCENNIPVFGSFWSNLNLLEGQVLPVKWNTIIFFLLWRLKNADFRSVV